MYVLVLVENDNVKCRHEDVTCVSLRGSSFSVVYLPMGSEYTRLVGALAKCHICAGRSHGCSVGIYIACIFSVMASVYF